MFVRVTTAYYLYLIVSVLGADDPCAAGNYHEFFSQNIGARKEGCLSSVFEECDHYFNQTLWYTSSVGKLLTHCPKDKSCGSPLPAWIDGHYPNETEGLVQRRVCIKEDTTCCHTNLTMEIKNCSTFVVFRLPRVPSCPSAYCFESNLPCETTTTSTTSSTTVTQPSGDGERSDFFIGMVSGGCVFSVVSIITGIIVYYKFWRKSHRISTDEYPVQYPVQYPVVITTVTHKH